MRMWKALLSAVLDKDLLQAIERPRRLGGDLLLLIRKHVALGAEDVDMGLLVTDLVADLRVRYTTAVPARVACSCSNGVCCWARVRESMSDHAFESVVPLTRTRVRSHTNHTQIRHTNVPSSGTATHFIRIRVCTKEGKERESVCVSVCV